jgi:hypothetical protein
MFRWLEWFFYDVLKFAHHPDRACPHMKGRLSDLTDGTAKGIRRWYTERHVTGCPGCASTLSGLRLLRARLLGIGKGETKTTPPAESLTLAPERWQEITRSWEQTDEKLAGSGKGA